MGYYCDLGNGHKLHLPHVYLQTTPDTKSKGKQSLNRKRLASFLWLLETILSLTQFKMSLKDFLNLVLVCKEISPRYGSDRIKVFFSTVVTWGRFMCNLLIIFLKHLSINNKGYHFLKKDVLINWFLQEILFNQNKF